MRVLFCGDIVGRSGRDAVLKHAPEVMREKDVHYVIVNAENAAHGFGVTRDITKQLYDVGVDAITLGNHAFDNKDILKNIEQDTRLVRPLNYPPHVPGRGFTLIDLPNGKKFTVVNLMARLFMNDTLDDPFQTIDQLLSKYPMGGSIQGIFVDLHGEATSEKMAIGHYLDGRVSAVVGTHTHVPTADAHILPKGTGYQTDAGMCGDYLSVIGMQKDVPLARFRKTFVEGRMQPASGEGTMCGTLLDIAEDGTCTRIEAIRRGPHLLQA